MLPSPMVMIGQWRYAGNGLRHGEALWAELARQRITTARRIAREREQPEPG